MVYYEPIREAKFLISFELSRKTFAYTKRDDAEDTLPQ